MRRKTASFLAAVMLTATLSTALPTTQAFAEKVWVGDGKDGYWLDDGSPVEVKMEAVMYVTKSTSTYKEASTDSKKVSKLKKGDAIDVVAAYGSFYRLSDNTYVPMSNVGEKRINWSTTKFSKARTRYIAKSNTKALKSALPSGKTVKTLKRGTKVTVVAKTNSGYYKLKDGSYVKQTDVTETKPKTYSAPSASAKKAGTGITLKASEGKVFNIWCWNDEFKQYFEKYYTVPKGVKINWIINTIEGGNYQYKLDEALSKQSKTSANDKIDLFLVEPDYIDKYIDSKYAMDLSTIGVKPYSTEYQYLIDLGTNSKNKYKAVGFQTYPSLLIYRRSIAEEVLGTSDPAKVQKKLDTWEEFYEVAELAAEKGYYMNASCNDMFRAYYKNTSIPLVKNGKLTLDDSIIEWAKQTKKLVDKGAVINGGLWDWQWANEVTDEGKTMCYYGPSWFYNYTMPGYSGGTTDGDWGVVAGPATGDWSGIFMVGATGSDNPQMIADVMNAFTANTEICKKLGKGEKFLPNNKTAAKALSKSNKNTFLGGQNDIKVQMEAAENIIATNRTTYDFLCYERFPQYMRDYFSGYYTFDEAMNYFYEHIKTIYPDPKIKK